MPRKDLNRELEEKDGPKKPDLSMLTPRQKGEICLALSSARIFEQWRIIFSFILASFPELGKKNPEFIKLRKSFLNGVISRAADGKAISKMLSSVAKLRMSDVRNSVNAATLLFSHSVLDALLLDLCRVTHIVNPSYWESRVEKRKVELGQVQAQGYQEVCRRKIGDFLKEVERGSLIEKAGHILRQCQPRKTWTPIRGFRFREAKLRRLDILRHDIAHQSLLGRKLPDALGLALYLIKVQVFFLLCVKQKFDLKLPAEHVLMARKLLTEISKSTRQTR